MIIPVSGNSPFDDHPIADTLDRTAPKSKVTVFIGFTWVAAFLLPVFLICRVLPVNSPAEDPSVAEPRLKQMEMPGRYRYETNYREVIQPKMIIFGGIRFGGTRGPGFSGAETKQGVIVKIFYILPL